MSIRLYCDEDSMRHAVVMGLRKRGLDVLTALDARTTEETDDGQLAFATARGRAIYSFNVGDFCDLHSQWLSSGRFHAGIVLAHQEQFPVGEQIRRLARLVNTLSPEEMQNRLEFLSDWGTDRKPPSLLPALSSQLPAPCSLLPAPCFYAPAIRVSNLSKRYSLGPTHAASIRELASRWADRLLGRNPAPCSLLHPPRQRYNEKTGSVLEHTIMATLTDIGTLITQTPGICSGRPRIAGTGISVRRIVSWYKMGLNPEEISRRIGHVSLAQVHAALAYYHANQEAMEAEIAAEEAEFDRLEQKHRASRAQA